MQEKNLRIIGTMSKNKRYAFYLLSINYLTFCLNQSMLFFLTFYIVPILQETHMNNWKMILNGSTLKHLKSLHH